MIRHHPDIHWLSEYAAGALPWAQALAVRTHLHFCPDCRQQVQRLETLGSELTRQQDPLPDTDALWQTVRRQLDTMAPGAPSDAPARNDRESRWPGCLARLMPDGPTALPWETLGRHLSVARLPTGSDRHEVALHRIRAGGSVFEHTHRGEEVTVVLQGSFSDELGQYHEGDFVLRDPDQTHAPLASRDEDCLCLTVQDSPVRFTHPLLRLLNPWLKIHPA